MPAGTIHTPDPKTVLPRSLSHAFVETQDCPARLNEYHDGSSQRSSYLGRTRRTWQLAKHLPVASLIILRDFWQARKCDAFYFYSPKETDPLFSYDTYGRIRAGRYRVRFANPWTQTQGLGLLDSNIELVELLTDYDNPPGPGSLYLADDLAILLDISPSMTSTDFNNEKAAAKSIVDLCAPLTGGGIEVYAFCRYISLAIAVSHATAAIKTAVDGITQLWDGTSLYDVIYTAAGTTAKYIILTTDGVDTTSSHTKDQAIAYCVAQGVKVFTVGIGADVSPTILTQIATGTGGAYYPAVTSGNLAAIVATIMTTVAL